MSSSRNILLAGQQNAGKSTLFNMLTGARQHVANYPGVTIDKKQGFFNANGQTFSVIDLPGTYSLSSFSLEEKVARDVLLANDSDLILNVVDAVNLDRSLNLTLQLMELEKPVALLLNMVDVAKYEGLEIDKELLASKLGLPLIETVASKSKGRDKIIEHLDYQEIVSLPYSLNELDFCKAELVTILNSTKLTDFALTNWNLLRILENDQVVLKKLKQAITSNDSFNIIQQITELRSKIEQELGTTIRSLLIKKRYDFVQALLKDVLVDKDIKKINLSEKIDNIVLNKYLAPLVFLITVYFIYQASIVYGYELTNYTWPYLAAMREFIASILPDAGFLYDPYTRSLGLWIVDSANTLLNYVPIFFILFSLIAILEDSGYMARIAFIVDKILARFGLHGQSTLPLILSGVFSGGCAVPGIMATKGIPDNRARMATILIAPFMNCLAKIPFYTLILGIFFTENKSLMMFYISTFSLIAALLVAKLLTKTVLKKTETAPFIMELPRYHLPTLRNVLIRAFERTWLYVKKVGTIVVAVSVVIFVLLQFPGIDKQQKEVHAQSASLAVDKFYNKLAGNPYLAELEPKEIPALLNFYTDHKRAKLNASGREGSKAVAVKFKAKNPELYKFIKPPRGDKNAKKVNRQLRKLASARKKIRRVIKEQSLEQSLLGTFGRSLEPITKFAGFDWKVNLALLSSFVARESSVATLGVLYQQSDDSNVALETRMGDQINSTGDKGLIGAAILLFFILYPPCLASVMVIKIQTGKYRWMFLSIALPTFLGFTVASITYTVGNYFNMQAINMISTIYFTSLALLLLVGLKNYIFKSKPKNKIIAASH